MDSDEEIISPYFLVLHQLYVVVLLSRKYLCPQKHYPLFLVSFSENHRVKYLAHGLLV